LRLVKRTPPPAFFSSKEYIDAATAFTDDVAADQKSFDKFYRLMPEILDVLKQEFGNQCAYCDSILGTASDSCIEHFYPKYKYPEKAFLWENLLLACPICNRAKRDLFPLASDGMPLLLQPGVDDPSGHITEQEDGYLVGLTDKGKETINLLQLNRPGLVEQRKRERLYQRIAESRPDLEPPCVSIISETIFRWDLINRNLKQYWYTEAFVRTTTTLHAICQCYYMFRDLPFRCLHYHSQTR
jgi:uncharacterized protein (TIGR02646 family)